MEAATVRCTVPRPPSGEWTICRSSMLTFPAPSTAVIRARAPGSSGISTCHTATPERTVGFAASPSLACFARSKTSLDRRCVAPRDRVAKRKQPGREQLDR